MEPVDIEGLAWMQIGVTGTMTADHCVRCADCSTTELIARIKLNEPPPIEWKRCLYLEWYSQNGRVVLEVADPILEFVEGEDTWDPARLEEAARDAETVQDSGPSVLAVGTNEDGEPEVYELHAETDAAQFEGDDLQRHLDAETRAVDRAIRGDDPDEADPIAELELFDDLLENGEGEPLGAFTSKPLTREQLAQRTDDQAEAALKCLLTELALYGIALHICEHFTPRDAYLLLTERLLKEGRAYPELRGTQWVTNLMTSEYCPECEAETELDQGGKE